MKYKILLIRGFIDKLQSTKIKYKILLIRGFKDKLEVLVLTKIKRK